jgi:hypothetical protein
LSGDRSRTDTRRCGARSGKGIITAAARHPKFGLPFLERLFPFVSSSGGLSGPNFALFAEHLQARRMRRSADFSEISFFRDFQAVIKCTIAASERA